MAYFLASDTPYPKQIVLDPSSHRSCLRFFLAQCIRALSRSASEEEALRPHAVAAIRTWMALLGPHERQDVKSGIVLATKSSGYVNARDRKQNEPRAAAMMAEFLLTIANKDKLGDLQKISKGEQTRRGLRN